jgi:hypothetical protein
MSVSRVVSCVSALSALALVAGCTSGSGGGPAGSGAVSFSTWGEEYIEQGIPAAELEDGWSITFSRFLVPISAVTVADQGAVAATQAGGVLFDHVGAGVKGVVSFEALPAKAYGEVSFEIVRASAGLSLDPSVEQADLEQLLADGASLYIEGAATKGAESKVFAWTFSTETRYEQCGGEVNGQEREGALVTNGGDDEIELTIHGDHFFYDDLQASAARLRFQPMADADADGDGDVTLDELDAVDLVDIAEGSYGTGSASDVNTLGDFVRHLSRTLGHFRGEGECLSRAL